MKKISIITIHCQTNFGSVFQAYALCKFINNLGYKCNIIDYRPDYIVNNYGNGIKGVIKKTYEIVTGNKSRKKYDTFIKNNFSLSTRMYYDYSELENEQFDSDVFIAGSDQLWNIGYECGNDKSYKLDFVKNVPKMSYATSLNTELMTKHDVVCLKNELNEFFSISLREKSSVDFFEEQMNIKAFWVCDPVFLLSPKDYEEICKDNRFGDYILVYLVDDTNLIEPVVSTIRRRTGYKVIYACGRIPKCKCDIHIKSPGPEEMLTLIKYAKVIVTGSFHATSFSHIFHKNFIVIKPNNADRISSLLSITNLEDRIIDTIDKCESIDINVDFSKCQNNLDHFINISKEWLVTNINKVEVINDKTSC